MPAKERRHRTFLLKEENKALADGVSWFGKENWKKIKDAYPVVLFNCTDQDLKDRWQNVEKLGSPRI
jgi:hypothetical protein